MDAEIRQLPLGPLQTNCYILACTATKHAAVIDPSWNGDAIAKAITDAGYTLTHILLTHTHFDHIGGLADLKAVLDVPVYAHPESLPFLRHGSQSAMRFGITMPDAPEPEEMLAENDEITIGNLKLGVLFTPGHAPGHVSFYMPSHNVVFSGDVLFQRSIGRTDLPGGDFSLLMDVIAEKMMTLPDETQVLSGHGAVTTIGEERIHNPFLQ